MASMVIYWHYTGNHFNGIISRHQDKVIQQTYAITRSQIEDAAFDLFLRHPTSTWVALKIFHGTFQLMTVKLSELTP